MVINPAFYVLVGIMKVLHGANRYFLSFKKFFRRYFYGFQYFSWKYYS